MTVETETGRPNGENRTPDRTSPSVAGQQPSPTPTPASVGNFITTLVGRVIDGVLNGPDAEPWRQHVRRLWIGAVGGLFYALLKNSISQSVAPADPHGVVAQIINGDLVAGYVAAASISACTGGTAAWLSAQRSARVLFLVGMMGTTIFVTLLPKLSSASTGKQGWLLNPPSLVTTAYAQSRDRDCVGPTSFERGFFGFFGVQERYSKYAVVVASGKNEADANSKLKAIKQQNPELDLRVGHRACDSQFYPVFATDFLPVAEANAALAKAKEAVSDAYLYPGPR